MPLHELPFSSRVSLRVPLTALRLEDRTAYHNNTAAEKAPDLSAGREARTIKSAASAFLPRADHHPRADLRRHLVRGVSAVEGDFQHAVASHEHHPPAGGNVTERAAGRRAQAS